MPELPALAVLEFEAGRLPLAEAGIRRRTSIPMDQGEQGLATLLDEF